MLTIPKSIAFVTGRFCDFFKEFRRSASSDFKSDESLNNFKQIDPVTYLKLTNVIKL